MATVLVLSLLSAQADAPQVADSPPSFAFLTAEAQGFPPDPTATPTPSPTPVPTDVPTRIPANQDWFGHINSYRDVARLPHLAELESWCEGGALHARYMVKNNSVTHSESPGNQWYTSQGAMAGQNSNILGVWDLDATDQYAIDAWMQSPFHAVGILDPELLATGFGSYREDAGNIRMAAALDVIRGLGQMPPEVGFPIMWPGEGSTIGITMHVGGSPDPLSSCPGYSAPAGVPIIMQMGPGHITVSVTAHSLRKNGVPVESCLFTEASYTSPSSGEEFLGRSILGARDAIVLVPKTKLIHGATYTPSVTVNGQTYEWSFRVATLTSDAPAEDAYGPVVPVEQVGSQPGRARGAPH